MPIVPSSLGAALAAAAIRHKARASLVPLVDRPYTVGGRTPLPTETTFDPGVKGVLQRAFLYGMQGVLGAMGVDDPYSSPAAGAGFSLASVLPIGAVVRGGRAVAEGVEAARGARAAAGSGEEAANVIRAYHGSPHDFDKFSLAKIGTGEGAQAYGHGLYFAENPSVAASYKTAGATGDVLTVRLPGQKPIVGDAIDDIGLDAIKFLESGAKRAGEFPHNTAYYAKELADNAAKGLPGAQARNAAVKARIDEWKDAKISYEKQRGQTYEVTLHASPDEFLDWDKPLSQQSEKVKEFFKDSELSPYEHRSAGVWSVGGKLVVFDKPTGKYIGMGLGGKILDHFDTLDAAMDAYGASTGSAAYGGLLKRVGGDAKASEALRAAGIKGIRYADAGSRFQPGNALPANYGVRQFDTGPNAGQWKAQNVHGEVAGPFKTQAEAQAWFEKAEPKHTSNYVVFDDAIIQIAKKYGIPLAAAATFAKVLKDAETPMPSHKSGG